MFTYSLFDHSKGIHSEIVFRSLGHTSSVNDSDGNRNQRQFQTDPLPNPEGITKVRERL